MKKLYLFYGDEKYLIKENERELQKSLIPPEMEVMNLEVYEGGKTEADKIIDSASTLPFMSDTRLIVARNTGFFSMGRKDETEKICTFLNDDLGYTVLLFIEDEVDKRNKLYKLVSKTGEATEFKALPEKELLMWTTNIFKKEGKKISLADASYFMMSQQADMESMLLEARKLCAYKGTVKEITKDDIDLVCTKALETKIFDLVKAIGFKNTGMALEIYNNLINLKQSPFMVLAMATRQFRLVLLAKYMQRKNYQRDEMSRIMGVKPYVAGEYLKQGANFTIETLILALEDCLETDVSIKTGKIDEKTGVELLIIKYSTHY